MHLDQIEPFKGRDDPKRLRQIDENALARYCTTWVRWRRTCAFLEKRGETYMLKDDKGNLSGKSVAMRAFFRPKHFSGQIPAHLSNPSSLSFGIDQSVFKSLHRYWKQRYVSSRKSWNNRKLFRSLEIAYKAARVPAVGSRAPTIHDFGIGIALWVSAFEILSHPKTANANRVTVLEVLDKVDWKKSGLKAKRYKLKNRAGTPIKNSNGTIRRFSFIHKLYDDLDHARNDFIHGNPVTSSNLFPSGSAKGPSLLECAPLVFRAALIGFLPIRPTPFPWGNFEEKVQSYVAAELERNRYERALEACRRRTR